MVVNSWIAFVESLCFARLLRSATSQRLSSLLAMTAHFKVLGTKVCSGFGLPKLVFL